MAQAQSDLDAVLRRASQFTPQHIHELEVELFFPAEPGESRDRALLALESLRNFQRHIAAAGVWTRDAALT